MNIMLIIIPVCSPLTTIELMIYHHAAGKLGVAQIKLLCAVSEKLDSIQEAIEFPVKRERARWDFSQAGILDKLPEKYR
jgi:hypothetical protein